MRSRLAFAARGGVAALVLLLGLVGSAPAQVPPPDENNGSNPASSVDVPPPAPPAQ